MKRVIAMMALIAIFNVEAAGQDMKVQYSQFTCDFPGFRDPFLFSILEKGKGRFNNIDVFVIVAKHPSRKKYHLIHFIERTRWILKSSATPEVLEEGLGGCFIEIGRAHV